MEVPLSIHNVVVGVVCGDSQPAQEALDAMMAQFALFPQDEITAPKGFDPETYPEVRWQEGRIALKFTRCVTTGPVPGNASPLDVVLHILHCPDHADLPARHAAVARRVGKTGKVPVETIGFYPTDAQLGDAGIAGTPQLHVVLPGQEALSCRLLIANALTRVFQNKVEHVGYIEGRSGIKAHHLLSAGSSGPLPHLLDGQSVAAAAALCCAAADASGAMGDPVDAAEYAVVAQRLIDTSLRDLALGGADLLETNRLTVQCSLALGGAVWDAVARGTTPAAATEGTAEGSWGGGHVGDAWTTLPADGHTGLRVDGRSVRRWGAAAEALFEGAVAGAAVVAQDPTARMLLSPLPPWAHAALMFAAACTAHMVAVQTEVGSAPALPLPPPPKSSRRASTPTTGSQAWQNSRQATQAATRAVQCAVEALDRAKAGGVPGGAVLAADVCVVAGATVGVTLATPDNLLCRSPRRAWSTLVHAVRPLVVAGRPQHALALALPALALALPVQGAALARAARHHRKGELKRGESWLHHSPTSAGTAAASAAGAGSRVMASTFAGASGSGVASPRRGSRAGPGNATEVASIQPSIPEGLWPGQVEELLACITAALTAARLPMLAREAALLWAGRLSGSGGRAGLTGAIPRPGTQTIPEHTAAVFQVALTAPLSFLGHAMHLHVVGGCFRGVSTPLHLPLAQWLSVFVDTPAVSGGRVPVPDGPWGPISAGLDPSAPQHVSALPWLSVARAEWDAPPLAQGVWLQARGPSSPGALTSPSRVFTSRAQRRTSTAEPSRSSLAAVGGDLLCLQARLVAPVDLATKAGALDSPDSVQVCGVWEGREVGEWVAAALPHAGELSLQIPVCVPSSPGTHILQCLGVRTAGLQSRIALPSPLHVIVPPSHSRVGICLASDDKTPEPTDAGETLVFPLSDLPAACTPTRACIVLPASLEALQSSGQPPTLRGDVSVEGGAGVEFVRGTAAPSLSLSKTALGEAVQTLGTGPGTEVVLVVWVASEPSGEGSAGLTVTTTPGGGAPGLIPVSPLPLPLTVPCLPGTWQPNEGPWDTSPPGRQAFWASVLRADGPEVGGVVSLSWQLDVAALPSRLRQDAGAAGGLQLQWECSGVWIGGCPTGKVNFPCEQDSWSHTLGMVVAEECLAAQVILTYPSHGKTLTCSLEIPLGTKRSTVE